MEESGANCKREIHYFKSFKEMSKKGAEFISQTAQKEVKRKGYFTLVLSGGKTPSLTYQYLSKKPFKDSIPWKKTYIFWGDERCVPKDHPESNFKMAFEAFLSKVPLPPENIYHIEADNKPPKEAARRYETSLRNFFASFKESRSFPPFDLIILGVGRDGHTASLFPKSSALKEKHRWAVDVFNPSASPPLPRITLTLPVINSAKYVLFLVSIKEKKETVQMILENPERARQLYPAAMVNPQEKLTWFITTLTN